MGTQRVGRPRKAELAQQNNILRRQRSTGAQNRIVMPGPIPGLERGQRAVGHHGGDFNGLPASMAGPKAEHVNKIARVSWVPVPLAA